MYKSILVPLDGSPLSEAALPVARDLARRSQAPLHLLLVHMPVPAYVAGPDGAIPLDVDDTASRTGEREYLDGIAGNLTGSGLGRVEPVLAQGEPGPVICDEVEHREAGVVVMATHGRGAIGRLLLGSVARHVVRHAGVPVLLVRPGVHHDFEAGRRLLVATDLQPQSSAFLQRIEEMAHLIDAPVNLLHVMVPSLEAPPLPPPAMMEPGLLDTEGAMRRAQDQLDRMAADLRSRGCSATGQTVIGVTAAAGILGELKREPYAMVAVNPHRVGLAERLLIGSTAQRVIRDAAVPVLVFEGSAPDVQ
jgi:nucleotide-binding universal stress UspA family protein